MIINSNALDRLLQRVWGHIAREEWRKAENLLEKTLAAKPWDKKLLLARAHLKKKMWLASDREDYELLGEAIDLFSRCHLLTGSAEAGINTATLLLLCGDEMEACRKATEVAAHCRSRVLSEKSDRDGFYEAVIAEASLIRGRMEAAQSWYEAASDRDETISDVFEENMNLLLDHIVPETSAVNGIREALRA